MTKSFPQTPTYDTCGLKTSSILELTANEVHQSQSKPRQKNAEREGKLNTSDTGAFLHVIKSSLGTGFLAMPYAIHNIGLVAGAFGTALVAILCTHCTYLVVKCSQELCYQQGKICMSYTETVEAAFEVGAGRRLRRWSGLMRAIANFFLFITYYGVTTVYVILIASTFKQVIENYYDYTLNIRMYVLLLTVVLLPVGIVRHIKFMVPFSALANVFLLIGCSMTLYYCFIDFPSPSSRPWVVDVSKWPLFFSTALFGMEGIGVVMPIENSVRKPANFLGCPGVLNIGLSVVGTLYLVVGVIGYIKYGDDIQGSITLNLPHNLASETVKILVALAILFTYPLQLTAPMSVIWENVSHMFSEKSQDMGYYLIRALLILGTVTIAIAVPNLSPVMSLVGAVGFSGLGLLIPTVTDLVTYWDTVDKPWGFTVIKAGFLIFIWAFSTVSGTVRSIHDIIEDYDIKT